MVPGTLDTVVTQDVNRREWLSRNRAVEVSNIATALGREITANPEGDHASRAWNEPDSETDKEASSQQRQNAESEV